MAEKTNSTEIFRAIIVVFATMAMIVFNALASAGWVNHITPDAVSAKYPTVVTPAGYAFTIWSLIYVGMIAFSIYQTLPSKLDKFRAVRTLYVLSCVFNCAWIYFWHRDSIGICLVTILALLGTLLIINVKLKNPESFGESLFTNIPFGIYFGWVTAAALINFAVWLSYVDVKMSDTAWSVLGVALIFATAGFAIIVRWRLKNYLYPLAIAWALTAIAVKQGGHTAIVMAAAFGVVTCMVTAGSFVVDLKDSTSE